MKKKFKGYYLPTDEEFKNLWEKCIFAIDANVLLNFYRYPLKVNEELFSVLETIKERVWLPHQSALEFHRNRLLVIAEQKKKFNEVTKILSDSQEELRNNFNKLQLKKRHSSIDPDPLIQKTSELIDKFNQKLEKLKSEHPDVFGSDAIFDKIDVLFSEKVGDPFSSEKIEKIYQEGKARFSKEIPPGYKDKTKKPLEFSYGGVTYNRKYGDLVLWKQIIEKVKNDKVKYVIFITDDVKEDWWNIVKSDGKKKIAPRPELIDEIAREGKVEVFHMYNSDQFMKYANKYLNIDVTPESLTQLSDIHQSVLKQYKPSKMKQDFITTPGFYIPKRRTKNVDPYIEQAIDNLSEIELAKEDAEIIMKNWFLENFEDPANCCPYESKEGGYQYIWGGPYDAKDELYSKFSAFYDEELMDKVVDELEKTCSEWSKMSE